MCEYVNIWASVHGCICVHAWDTCNFACLPGCMHTHARTHARTHAHTHTGEGRESTEWSTSQRRWSPTRGRFVQTSRERGKDASNATIEGQMQRTISDLAEQVERLVALEKDGHLTADEFRAAKLAVVLSSK